MAEVTIGAESYTTYADVAAADAYAGGAHHATAWRAETDDDVKARALVSATRILDRQKWKSAYDTFAEREVVDDIVNASIEIAIALVDGTDVQNEANTAQKIQSLKAGSVALSFFRGAEGSPDRFPLIIMELLRDYLVGGTFAKIGTSSSSGVDGESLTAEDLGYSQPI